MPLTDFFRINFPYGIKRNDHGEWTGFNREYSPLGFNKGHYHNNIEDLPIHTGYKGVTEKLLKELGDTPGSIEYDDQGMIVRVFFYNDATNPVNQNSTYRPDKPELWDSYFRKMKKLSKLKVKNK